MQRVAQVLTNFVGNAIKFTPEGGTITVRAESEPGQGSTFWFTLPLARG